MLVRLLKTFPGLPESDEIRSRLHENFTVENLSGELEYLQDDNRAVFERTYGWAWLLKLSEELDSWNDPDGRIWSTRLEPLAAVFVRRFAEFIPRQLYPIRTGVHSNTAFGLAFAWDYGQASGDSALTRLIDERSRSYFENDRAYPAMLEPSGEDFLSPCLIEADLMQRLMPPEEFREWFHSFLPDVDRRLPKTLLMPVKVADRSDGRMVHLDGLNLSRAWCMRNIAAALPGDDSAGLVLAESAQAHAVEGLAGVYSGDYAGQHWLASFAVYMRLTAEPAS